MIQPKFRVDFTGGLIHLICPSPRLGAIHPLARICSSPWLEKSTHQRMEVAG